MRALKDFLIDHQSKFLQDDFNIIDYKNAKRYHIPDLEYDTFLRLYADALHDGDSQLHLNEQRKKNEHFNMFADIDIGKIDINFYVITNIISIKQISIFASAFSNCFYGILSNSQRAYMLKEITTFIAYLNISQQYHRCL